MSCRVFYFYLQWTPSLVGQPGLQRVGELVIRWKFVKFADDIALLSSRYVDKTDNTSRLVEEAARSVNARNDQIIDGNGEQVDEVEEFEYLL